jgi:ribosomal protein S15P/S13E
MVHRRQKLLKYLKRKEKGGVRYRNVLEALGLDDDAVEKELFL